jgi:hypothetical protein
MLSGGASTGDPRREGPEVGGGAKAAADSSAAGCLKDERPISAKPTIENLPAAESCEFVNAGPLGAGFSLAINICHSDAGSQPILANTVVFFQQIFFVHAVSPFAVFRGEEHAPLCV